MIDVYDNPATMAREYYVDGILSGFVSATLIATNSANPIPAWVTSRPFEPGYRLSEQPLLLPPRGNRPPMVSGHPAHHWAGRRCVDPARYRWRLASSRRRYNERHRPYVGRWP